MTQLLHNFKEPFASFAYMEDLVSDAKIVCKPESPIEAIDLATTTFKALSSASIGLR
jgi:hypothetical protein